MNREEKGGGVEGNLDQEREGRETCKLYCEEAFKQRRACERRGSQYLNDTENTKGERTGARTKDNRT